MYKYLFFNIVIDCYWILMPNANQYLVDLALYLKKGF